MATKNILAIFLISLSAGTVLAKPHTVVHEHFKNFNLCHLKEVYASLAPTEKDHSLKSTIQLMKVVVFDLSDLSLSYVQKAKIISDNLLKEPVVTSSKQTEVIKFKHSIEEFVKKYNECKEIDELFDLMALYSNATSHYYEQEAEGTLNTDAKVVYDVLIKYSPKDLDDEFENEFLNTFFNKFGQKINDVRESLKREDGEIGVKILQWWDKTKTLKTTEEKVEAFKEYIKLYGVDDE